MSDKAFSIEAASTRPPEPHFDRQYRVFTRSNIDEIRQLATISRRERTAMKAVSAVFPFRVNNYVLDDLIDWSKVPDDPIFQLTFPRPGML